MLDFVLKVPKIKLIELKLPVFDIQSCIQDTMCNLTHFIEIVIKNINLLNIHQT